MGEYSIEISKKEQNIDSNNETHICVEAENSNELERIYKYVKKDLKDGEI